MTNKEWSTIEYFKSTEKFGDPYKMDYQLIWLLDKLRKELDHPVIVHCGYKKIGHAPKSYHYKGQAVDFHVHGIGLYTAWEHINKMWWMGGAGIYPEWNNPGFHLDIGPYRRWYRNKEGYYLSIVNGVFENKI